MQSVATSTTDDLSFLHLQAELRRIDVHLQRLVRRWQQAGQDPGDAFRGLYVSDDEASALLKRPFAGNWGAEAAANAELEAHFEAALQAARQECLGLEESAAAQGGILRLHALKRAFGLDEFDLDVFLICLAPSLDLRYERLYGYLQDDVTRKRPTVNLVLDLLCEPGPRRLLQLPRFGPESPLFYYRLLEKASGAAAGNPPVLAQALSVDESVLSWLLGRFQPHEELLPMVHLLRAHPAVLVDGWQENVLEALGSPRTEAQAASARDAETPVVAFYGPDLAGQEAAAHFLAAHLGMHLLNIDLSLTDHSASDQPDRAPQLRLALRDARLAAALPLITGWDAVLVDGQPAPRLLAEIFAYPGPLVLSGRSFWRPAGFDHRRPITWLEFDIPTYPQRRALWEHFLQGGDLAALGITALAGQFQLTTGQIRDAVASARDWVRQSGEALSEAALFAAARLYSNPRLSSLARKLQPRFGWDDIVLPTDQRNLLHELINTVRQRPRVLDEWGVGLKLASSRGVTVLFAGPPGTGKTMAAEVISGELGLDLYKIDLSTVVSKYIGETEKNLERIFNEAETSNAILFFDEADSLFGKRSEVRDSHDRYANIEISYLLQRMEAYDGVTILATNLRSNLDEAFTRRLQFAVDFPFPEEADRLRIWNTLFPPDVPRNNDVDLGLLARRFKLAGGNIRNIIVNAAYLAAGDGGTVSMSHLLHGTRRELQKMGRLVSEGDMLLE
jgi:hypothetical protein